MNVNRDGHVSVLGLRNCFLRERKRVHAREQSSISFHDCVINISRRQQASDMIIAPWRRLQIVSQLSPVETFPSPG